MLQNVLDKIKQFDPFGWKKERRESVFLDSNFDTQAFQEAREKIPPLQQAWETWDEGGQWEQGNPTQDLFYSMLKNSPQYDPKMKDGLRPLKSIIEQTMDLPEFAKLKKRAVGNPLCAGIGAAGLVDKAMELVPDEATEAAKEAEKAQAQADEAERKAQAAQAMLQALKQSFDDLPESDEGLADWLENGTDQQQQAAQQFIDATEQAAFAQADKEQAQAQVINCVQAFDKAMEENEAQFQAGLNTAIGETADDAQDKAQFVQQFGLAAGYNPQEIDLDVIRAALDIYSNQNFSDFADMIGFAQSVATSTMRQTLHGRNDNVRTRNMSLNPSRMTQPEKLAAMGVKGLAVQQDWSNRALENRVRHTERDKGRKEAQAQKGDILVIRDDSGSTYGQIHSLLVSVEWQLLKQAKLDNRGFCSIPFSGTGQFHEWRPPASGEKNAQALTDHFKLHYGGGTEPYRPVLHAFDVIERESYKADIVLMTDGQIPPASADFLARLENLQATVDINVYVVLVGSYSDDYQIDWATETINIRNLADKAEIKRIFERTL